MPFRERSRVRAGNYVVNAVFSHTVFYRYVYEGRADHWGIDVVLVKSGLPITNNRYNAVAFNHFFSSVSTTNNNVISCFKDVTLNSMLHSILISEVDDEQSIIRLSRNSSCGPDRLSSVFFKSLKYCLSQPLALIYNQRIYSVGAVGLLLIYTVSKNFTPFLLVL